LLKISENKRFFVTRENKPFFWFGGTSWELTHFGSTSVVVKLSLLVSLKPDFH
jgi:hypothetical protein